MDNDATIKALEAGRLAGRSVAGVHFAKGRLYGMHRYIFSYQFDVPNHAHRGVRAWHHLIYAHRWPEGDVIKLKAPQVTLSVVDWSAMRPDRRQARTITPLVVTASTFAVAIVEFAELVKTTAHQLYRINFDEGFVIES